MSAAAPTPPVPGSPEHDAAMAAKVDAAHAKSVAASNPPAIGAAPAAPAQAPAVPQRPADVPEKFWNAAKGELDTTALLKSYTELERGKPAAPAQPPAQQPAKTTEGEADPAAAAQEAIKAAKLDPAALTKEFTENGAISEASYKALEAAGFGKDIVDGYIAGQQALGAQRDAKGFEAAGGKAQWDAMAAWANTGLTESEQAAFNKAAAGTVAEMQQAVVALKAKYEAAVGKEPALVQAAASGAGVTDGAYASRREALEAQKDPRYKNDPAYRSSVERRIGLMENW